MSPQYLSVKSELVAHEQVLRDPLAADRTILANERTFLAYIRTAMTLLVGGISLLSFFPSDAAKLVGVITIIPALILIAVGSRRYYYLRKYLTR